MQSRTVRNLAIAMIAVALCLGLFALRLVRDLRRSAQKTEVADTHKELPRVVVENTRVLAYGANVGRREQDGKDDTTNNARTAVLAVPEQDVDRLMLGASKGLLRLALRGDPVDGEPAAATEAHGAQYESLS